MSTYKLLVKGDLKQLDDTFLCLFDVRVFVVAWPTQALLKLQLYSHISFLSWRVSSFLFQIMNEPYQEIVKVFYFLFRAKTLIDDCSSWDNILYHNYIYAKVASLLIIIKNVICHYWWLIICGTICHLTI